MKLRRVVAKFFDERDSVGDFIFAVLCIQKPDPVRVICTEIGFQYINVAVLAAKTEHKHATRIRMPDQISENCTRHLLVVAHLRAAVWMWEGTDRINARAQKALCGAFNGSSGIIDTTNGRDDPDFVAHADGSIASSISVKIAWRCGGRCGCLWGINIIQKLAETGFHIVRMYPCTGRNVLCGGADRIAVFYHRIALGVCLQGKFVSLRNVLF